MTARAALTPVPDEYNLPVGYVAGDEPRAARIGRDVLAAGGNAADAAAAMGFALSVTLPSRVANDGGGACLVHMGAGIRSINFPGLARGLRSLHGAHGRMRWERVVAPAEALARLGAPPSKALEADFREAGLASGGAENSRVARGEGSPADFLAALRQTGGDQAGEPPAWRNETPFPFLSRHAVSLPLTPRAATAAVAVDKTGGAVACIFSRGGLFGHAGTDSAVPAAIPSAMLVAEGETFYAAFISTGDDGRLSALAARALSAGQPLDRLLAEAQGPPGGLVSGIVCVEGLPAEVANCQTRADPRGFGLAGIAVGR